MLEVTIFVSKCQMGMLEKQNPLEIVTQLTDMVSDDIGSVSRVRFYETRNGSDILVSGLIYPECDGETEISDDRYRDLLTRMGESLNEKLHVDFRGKVSSIVNFRDIESNHLV